MQGDFSRVTFNPEKHFLRVLMQQGRVQIDADFNEQAAILLHYMRTLAADLIGPHGGPPDQLGFAVIAADADIDAIPDLSSTEKDALKKRLAADGPLIGPGRYYVEGLACENHDSVAYRKQLYAPAAGELQNGVSYLAYLDAWEQHISGAEDKGAADDERIPGIREVALRGADTATRSRVAWRVRMIPLAAIAAGAAAAAVPTAADLSARPMKPLAHMRDILIALDQAAATAGNAQPWLAARPGTGSLKARADPGDLPNTGEPCAVPPDARYRRAENQLYRVEVHRPGFAADATNPATDTGATFKWSRENGSVVLPIADIHDDVVRLAAVGRDDNLGLNQGDIVEVLGDRLSGWGMPGELIKVKDVDGLTVTLASKPQLQTEDELGAHRLLRRWDHGQPGRAPTRPRMAADNSLLIRETDNDEQGWLTLEDGVQVQFQPLDDGRRYYCTGDYWLIPARTATRDVEWPRANGGPAELAAHGVEHVYAPLAILDPVTGGRPAKATSCRRIIS